MVNLEKGENSTVRILLNILKREGKIEDVNDFFLDSLARNYEEFSSFDEIESSLLCSDKISYNDSMALLSYSGFNFKHINNALRDTWNYEDNGDISRRDEFLKEAMHLSEVISKNPTYGKNFKTYRGVTLDSFKDYGINSMDELKEMEGKCMYDGGFISTSLMEDKCFFQKENELGLNYNVKIEYLVPEEFDEGIYIGNNSNLSYSPDQCEYLINNCSLSKVFSVNVSNDKTATLKAVMIPKKIYEKNNINGKDNDVDKITK